MKLVDLLTKETWERFGDMDVFNDTIDDMFPAWCGTMLTDKGKERFHDALELDAEVRNNWDGTVIEVHLGTKWKHDYKVARDLFESMCGYCTEEEYEEWFTDEEPTPTCVAMETIRCPKCGKELQAMEPFYDTEENEWNYVCRDCGFDITIFVKEG